MGITNRTLDATEQRRTFQASYGAVSTGLTLSVLTVPFNSTLAGIRMTSEGLSGAPTYAFKVQRFIVGTGITAISGGSTTTTGVAYGTSGLVSVPIAAAGSTLLNLLAGDLITCTTGGANTATTSLTVSVVIQAVQDIKTNFSL